MNDSVMAMKPLEQFPDHVACAVTTVFSDIDDTLTSDGRLPASAYQALEDLFEAGFNVVPVTGRPAGWCDMIARFWPVNGVVGENGAFYFSHAGDGGKMMRVWHSSHAQRRSARARLQRIKARVLKEVPGCAVSADQPYREADLAIDFCEDVPDLGIAAAQKIKDIAEQEGATAKISSIHVNCWYGDFDKLSMARRFAREVLGFDLDSCKERAVFCGDSPNDVPMFGYFPNSCGVANICDLHHQLAHLPAYVTAARGGEGFAELAQMLLAAR